MFPVFFSEMPSDTRKLKQLKPGLKTRKGHAKVTPITHYQWAECIERVRKELGWTVDEMCEFTGVEIGWLKKARGGQNIRGDFREKFEDAIRKKWKEKFPEKPALALPDWVDGAPSFVTDIVDPPVPRPTIDDTLLSDYLTGVGFAQWLGSEDEWLKTIRAGKSWLKENPEDCYCRGMLLWSVLNKGNPSEMIEILNETARWLASVRPVPTKPNVQFDTQAWRQKCDHKIHQLSSDAVEHPMFVRWHMEDTVVRAALMRYLRFQAAGSQLESEFANLGRDLEKQIVMKWLFDSTKSQRGDAWVAAAVKHINEWAGHELVSGLAWLCLLWFTGRQKQRDQMQLALEQSSQWLEGNPDQAFVRWAAIGLAGLLLPLARSEEPVVRDLIEKSAEWLKTPAAKEDRLVRMGVLWLVGAYGNPAQVRLHRGRSCHPH